MRTIVLDFETRSAADLKVVGAWKYSEHPTTKVICLRWRVKGDTEEPWAWEPIRLGQPVPEELRELAADPDTLFEAHNALFEQAIWHNVMHKRWGLPDIPVSRWRDTMAICAHKNVPMPLEAACLAMQLPVQKDMEGNRLLRQVSQPKKLTKAERKEWADLGLDPAKLVLFDEDPVKLERVNEYCGTDVEAEDALGDALGELPPDELEIWHLDQEINRRGVFLDREAIRAARLTMKALYSRVNARVAELTDGQVTTPNQTDRMSAWVKERAGREPKNWQSDYVKNVIEKGDRLPPDVLELFKLRQQASKASTSKLDRMEATICADGRSRGLLQYQGASTTGRWAGRIWQPQNLPRGALGEDPDTLIHAIKTMTLDEMEERWGDAAQVVSDALRSVIRAEPGYELVAGDFSAIEARIGLALAEQWDRVKVMADGHDVYCDMAETIYGYKVNKKDNPDERRVGKSAVLGLGFQCGADMFKEKFLPNKPVDFCEVIVPTSRSSGRGSRPRPSRRSTRALARSMPVSLSKWRTIG